MTYKSALKTGILSKTISRLEDNGVASSRVNTEVMLSELLGCRVIDLYTDDVDIKDRQAVLLKDMVERRISGEPLQYIIKKAFFYGNEFYVEPGVFIPRPETEVLVSACCCLLKEIMEKGCRNPLVLDLCTGSGAVAISLTKDITQCKIIGSDISDAALKAARRNAILNAVSERTGFIKADLFDLPQCYKNGFDAIVSNPPYIATGLIKDLPKEVGNEPLLALDGKQDGLYFYRMIVRGSCDFLKKEGFIALEIGDNMRKQVEEIIEDSGLFYNIETVKDLNNKDRVITAKKRLDG